MTGDLEKRRLALEAKLKELERTAPCPRTLIFTDNTLHFLGSCSWLPEKRDWRDAMCRMRESGATGYFVAFRRERPVEGETTENVSDLRLFGDHLGLSLIKVLRWR